MNTVSKGILDDLIQELGAEESNSIRELQTQYEKIISDYNQEVKKYIEWKINHRNSIAYYEHQNKLQDLREQREEITRDIHSQMGWIHLIQRYRKLN